MEKGSVWAADAGHFKFKADDENIFSSLFSGRGRIQAIACGDCGFVELYLKKE